MTNNISGHSIYKKKSQRHQHSPTNYSILANTSIYVQLYIKIYLSTAAVY